MQTVLWYNEYRFRDGRRVFSLPCDSHYEAVRVGGHEQGLHGSLVVFRWRVVARMPDIFAEGAVAEQAQVEARLERLEDENKQLKEDNWRLVSENARLQTQIQEMQAALVTTITG